MAVCPVSLGLQDWCSGVVAMPELLGRYHDLGRTFRSATPFALAALIDFSIAMQQLGVE
jgi:hypothetical protein